MDNVDFSSVALSMVQAYRLISRCNHIQMKLCTSNRTIHVCQYLSKRHRKSTDEHDLDTQLLLVSMELKHTFSTNGLDFRIARD